MQFLKDGVHTVTKIYTLWVRLFIGSLGPFVVKKKMKKRYASCLKRSTHFKMFQDQHNLTKCHVRYQQFIQG